MASLEKHNLYKMIEAGNQPSIGHLLFDFESCDSSVDGKLLYIYFLLASECELSYSILHVPLCTYTCVQEKCI